MKRKRYTHAFLLLIGLSGLATGCGWSDFGDTNVNPNASTEPIPSALLTSSLDFLGGLWGGGIHRIAGMYCQYISETQFTETSRYRQIELSFGVYSVALMDLENIIQLNSREETRQTALTYGSNNNQIAVARILQVFFFARLTDIAGDLPYSEALDINIVQPIYDRQESIYQDLFKELEEAVQQFDEGPPALGDILFYGDIRRWKQLANSLRLILAVRLSEVDSDLGAEQARAALRAEEGVIGDNFDNAILNYPGGDFQHPWFRTYLNSVGFAMSDVFAGYLSSIKDPRLLAFGSPSDSGGVIGVPYGLPREQAIEFTDQNPDFALILAPEWRQEDSGFPILTAADVTLARAEAAALGWTEESAPDLYEEGIRLSMQQWEVFDPDTFNDYMNTDAVNKDTGDLLKKIRFQRWVSFFPNGYYGWTIWRRTGVPDLQPTPFAVNTSGQIPRRLIYWTQEAVLNEENYREAAERLEGGDTMDGRVWWDVRE